MVAERTRFFVDFRNSWFSTRAGHKVCGVYFDRISGNCKMHELDCVDRVDEVWWWPDIERVYRTYRTNRFQSCPVKS
jgi:hypothetical protein